VSDDCPTLSEVEAAIKHLRNFKASGGDGISAELLKYCQAVVLLGFIV